MGQGHPLLHSTFQSSLGFLKIYLKTNKQANKTTKHASKQINLDQPWERWAEPAVSLLGGVAAVIAAACHALEGSHPGLHQAGSSSWLSVALALYLQLLLFLCTLQPLGLSCSSISGCLWVFSSCLNYCSHSLTRQSPGVLQSLLPQGSFLSLRRGTGPDDVTGPLHCVVFFLSCQGTGQILRTRADVTPWFSIPGARLSPLNHSSHGWG